MRFVGLSVSSVPGGCVELFHACRTGFSLRNAALWKCSHAVIVFYRKFCQSFEQISTVNATAWLYRAKSGFPLHNFCCSASLAFLSRSVHLSSVQPLKFNLSLAGEIHHAFLALAEWDVLLLFPFSENHTKKRYTNSPCSSSNLAPQVESFLSPWYFSVYPSSKEPVESVWKGEPRTCKATGRTFCHRIQAYLSLHNISCASPPRG